MKDLTWSILNMPPGVKVSCSLCKHAAVRFDEPPCLECMRAGNYVNFCYNKNARIINK